MLDKKEPFSECLGQLVDNVKYIQKGNAYKPNGEYLGQFEDGKLTPKRGVAAVKSQEVKPVREPNLSDMDRPTLLDYALEKFGVKLKGNASAESLRKQIGDLD